MNTIIHAQCAAGRWNELSPMQQLGNIGSEVERTLRAKETGNRERFEKAFERVLELIDLTINDPKWSGRRKELLRTREVLCDYSVGDNVYSITPDQLRKDFLYYGIAARAGETRVEL